MISASLDRAPETSPETGLLDRILANSPLASVKGRVIFGFGLLIIILVGVIAGAAFQTRAHQAAIADAERHSKTASLLQTAEANASISGLLLQRYVISQDDIYVEEIAMHADAATAAMNEALESDVEGLQEVYGTATILVQDAARTSALVQNGDVEEASVLMEQIVPIFREFRLQLEELANLELAEVAAAREREESTGQLAMWLLVISGAIGVALALACGFFIVRSVIKPLIDLEATAHKVSAGDLSARAPTAGPQELAHLGGVLNEMMIAIEENTESLSRANLELAERHRQLTDARSQAATDPLTGLGNHRSLHKRLAEEVLSAGQAGSTVSLILFDLDGFKDVNDSEGHQAGDRVLRDIAEVLCKVVSDAENCYRYGGDELAVILPAAGCQEAKLTAADIRDAVAGISIDGDLGVTASIGVAAYPESADSAKELVYRADMAMYSAKATGKNRVTVWGGSLNDHIQGVGSDRQSNGRGNADIVAALTKALCSKDPLTKDHADRCSWYSAEIAAELGLDDKEISVLRVASLLHDIGKLVVPDDILSKPGPLNASERARIRRHPVDGSNILSNVPSAADALPVIRHHHEHFDGSGYPDGLSRDEIPIEARIMLVADAFDAMVEDRPYRKAIPIPDAVEELWRCSGTQFDPQVVRAFMRVLLRAGRITDAEVARHLQPTALGDVV
jgi:diguanylate cyclase (GGDEF)-like protein